MSTCTICAVQLAVRCSASCDVLWRVDYHVTSWRKRRNMPRGTMRHRTAPHGTASDVTEPLGLGNYPLSQNCHCFAVFGVTVRQATFSLIG